MNTTVAAAGRGSGGVRAWLGHLGRSALLLSAMARALRRPRKWVGPLATELRHQSLGALPLVLFLTALGGAVTSQQTGYQFQDALPLWVIGSVVAASVVTELAPLLTGIALVGIVGARITAELGAMKVTQQVDALEMIGREPVVYLVLPRVLAGVLAAPVLVALALAASLLAGYAAAIAVTPVTGPEFIYGVKFYMRDFPLFFALIKGAVFGFAITFIACYVGLQARGGSTGVGQATTHGVVAMLTAVLVLDSLLAPLLKVIPV